MSETEGTGGFYARVIKRLGRNARAGEHGPLESADAKRLWHDLLAERFTPAQEAALLMGLRVHGESAAMLAAFARVTLDASSRVAAPPDKAVVVLHCLGTARKQPILAPLLAFALARAEVPVLMVTHDARRGANTAAVLGALAERAADDAHDAALQLARRCFAWVPIERIAPGLARVLARRAELGFRNSAHSLVKLLVPIEGDGVVVANYTHAPYRQSFAQAAHLLRLSALLVRGTEGDPVAWEADAHPSLAWIGGEPTGSPVQAEVIAGEPASLPQVADTDATARFTEDVLQGQLPMPAPIARQYECLAYLAATAADPAQRRQAA
ncbi:MAG TPA: DNA-binding protein YbiB [Burkholderiaceae bacterium]|nr:DNA-binding protein YbiB [Burkholderiaceae bacterium]